MNDKEILATNLKRRRLVLGLDQTQLAEMVRISRVAYVNIESGKSMPHEETLNQLSAALHVSIFDLFKESEYPKSILFRTYKTTTVKENASQDQTILNAYEWVKNYVSLIEITNTKIDFSFMAGVKRNKSETIESFALRVRSAILNRCNGSIDDIPGILESFGIKLLFTPFLTNKCFGFSFGEQDGGPAIIVNTGFGISAERQLFTLIHEFGHLLLHKDEYKPGKEEENSEQEKEANKFAAEFLMPTETFKTCWNSREGMLWFDRIVAVKRIFKVSYQTVLNQLLEIEGNDKNDADKNAIFNRFKREYEKRFGRELLKTIEPCPSSIEFTPGGYLTLAKKAFLAGEISQSRLAELLNISLMKTYELTIEWGKTA